MRPARGDGVTSGTRGARGRAAAGSARGADAARLHWRHLLLAALGLGLLARPGPPVLIAVAVVAAGLTAIRVPHLAAAATLAILAGEATAGVRIEAIDGAALAPAPRAVSGEATVLEAPRARLDGSFHARVRLDPGGVAVAVFRAREPPPLGAIAAVEGRVRPLGRSDAHQRLRGARAVIDVGDWRDTGRRRGAVAGALDSARRRAERALTRGIDPVAGALARGMVLGQDEALPRDVREDFERSGLAHLLAVSGQNVMLLCLLVFGLAALAGVPLRTRILAALALTAVYVPLAGGGVSIQRAGVMGAAGLVATLAGRPSSRWYALGLAAVATLVLNPRASAEPGWQLSFAAVAGLLAWAAPLRQALTSRRCPRPLAEVAAVTGAATLATAPLLALHFEQVSVVSLPANLVAAPAVAPLMWLGMLASAVAQVSLAAAAPLAWLCAPFVAFVAGVAQAAARPEWAATGLGLPVWGALAAYAVAAALTLGGRALWRRPAAWWRRTVVWRAPAGARPRGRRAGPAGFGLALAALAAALLAARAAGLTAGGAPPIPRGDLVVSFLDVGQGDATLIQHRGAALLVDTGPPGGPIVRELARAGVTRLDALVITHAQADHEGAAPEVLARIPTRLVLNGGAGWPSPVQQRLARTGVRRVAAHAGQRIRLAGLDIRILWPPPGLPRSGDPNLAALVAHVRAGDFDLLLPADAESGVTSRLDLPPVEALKVAHHGSADPGLPALLDRITPRVAAIEVGRDNDYGHPTPSTLQALRTVPDVVRTDRDGTTRLHVAGGRMWLERPG
jgi:competence protein ComEC